MITRKKAETDERLYPLMNYFIGRVNEFYNWKYIKSLQLIPYESLVLYRGLDCDEKDIQYTSDTCTSWTRSKKVAECFGKTILICEFHTKDMVFDSRFLDKDLFVSHRWQQEVIIKPIISSKGIVIEK
jgi:hypothetical protein